MFRKTKYKCFNIKSSESIKIKIRKEETERAKVFKY